MNLACSLALAWRPRWCCRLAAVTVATMTKVVLLVQGGSHDGGDGSSDPTMLLAMVTAMVALCCWRSSWRLRLRRQ